MKPGTRLANRYLVKAALGAGGFATALRVRDLVCGADVALKIVGAPQDSDTVSTDALLRQEFLALRGASHPRLARVHDFGYCRDERGKARAFYTSTLVHGVSLARFAEGRTWSDLVLPVGDVLSALASLHRRGVLHGDVHTGNVLVDASGRAVVIDLSCCRPLSETRALEISGTPAFLAPELLRGVVHRTADLYSLGTTIRSLGVVLPEAVARAVARLLSPRPEDRPQSAEEAAEILGVPWHRSPGSDLLGGALVGRDDACARGRATVDATARGVDGPRVVAIRGDDGVGRTRFLEELKVEAQLQMEALLVQGSRPGAIGTLLALAVGEDIDLASSAAVVRAVERIAARRDPIALLIDDAHALGPADRARLAVLLRTAPRGGKLVVVVASRDAIEGDARVDIALAPLDERQVRAWLGAEIPAGALGQIMRVTGGYPRELAALLTQIDGAAWDSRALLHAFDPAGTGRRRVDLGGLSDEALNVLAAVVAGGSFDVASTSALGVDELLRRGLVVHDPDGLRLLRRADATGIAIELGEGAMRLAHRALAAKALEALETDPRRDDVRATWIVHLAALDPSAAAHALAAAPAYSSAIALRPAVDAVVSVADDPGVVLQCARIYVEAGEPSRSLALVARAMARRPPRDDRLVLRQLAGQCYAQMGDSRRAVAILRRLLPSVTGRADHALVAAALSLALLKRSADADAIEVVRRALEPGLALEMDASVRLDLVLNATFATSRVGSTAEARGFLDLARDIAHRASPRGRLRLASATAFVEYGAGETSAAVRAYKEALDLATEHGLDDLVPSAALNYGTACHEQGDFGLALDAYARGRRLAVALGMPTTEVTLSFNLAKIYADIGSHDRAARHAEAARQDALREEMPLLAAGASAILAEIATAAGEHAASARHLDEAERLIAGAGAREKVDLAIQRARAQVAAGDFAGADRVLGACAAAMRTLSTPDAEAAWLGARAAVAVAEGRAAEATLDLERAIRLAEGCGQRGLLADLEAGMADAYAAIGSTFLAERHNGRARELWERALAMLPSDLREDFRRHPRRARTFAQQSAPTPTVETPLEIRRILEINRRLNSATTTHAVLEETMDAAISLTNAERGFLLVGTRGARDGVAHLRVAVARNFDRENLRQGHLKFSRTVAERVVRTGEPVVAVDAGLDSRFAKSRSVHAMRLKSVLCVPIRSPDGILGAIYVDHRLSAGGFRPELVDLLFGLSDQAALAIVKASLVEDLRSKTRELEERNAEVERLAREQALEITRLKSSALEEDDRASGTGTRRFDYGDIVATSAPMRRVLGVLDRVIDADVTILIRGESGTGKERVARAIHKNSSRASGPFVAINCGALPESLLEAELFGYRKGAFSGATRDHPGLFVSARGGSLFLDELGEMPLSMQVKLLRVLQEREVRPLGANEAVATDVRLVCATNRVLSEEVRAGRFREDLFYRIAVVEIELPPLRDRIEDILPLARSILRRLATDLGRPEATLDRTGERALFSHAFPGNVRELENVLTKGFLLARTSSLGAADLELGEATVARGANVALRARIQATLEETDWNVVLVSRLLGIPRATLYRKMRRYELTRPARPGS